MNSLRAVGYYQIVVVGIGFFFKFGWISTFAVLGVEMVRGTLGGLIDRRM